MFKDQADSTEDQRQALPAALDAASGAAREVAAAGPAERVKWLHAMADALDANADELVAVADEETALGEPRLVGELARTTGQLRFFATVVLDGGYLEAVIDHADPDAAPVEPDLRRLLQPIGPVGVFAASNFPFAFSVAGGDTASALAAGCPVIVKAHPGHPRTSDATARLVEEALSSVGAPSGAFAMVHGFEAGKELVCSPAIRAIGFTGSLAGGRALFDLAAGREDPIPFYGELGSLNPVVITDAAARARSDELASGLMASATLGVGQFCTKPGVVLAPNDPDLLRAISTAGSDSSGGVMLTDKIAEGFQSSLIALAGHDGVEVLAGDPSTALEGRSAEPVLLVATTERLLQGSEGLLEECFGPATFVFTYESSADLSAALEVLRGSLTVTVHAEPHEADDIISALPRLTEIAGRVIFGGWPTGVTVGWAQHHGGPWPATTAPLHTSVGASAIKRFLRPIAYQDAPEAWLPAAVRDDNPLDIPQRVDGQLRLP